MNLFHIFTVTPVEVEPHALPRVQYRDFYICAADLQAAFVAIRDDTWPDDVRAAAEVFGARVPAGVRAVINPATKLNQQEGDGQHQHWVSIQERYELLHQGPESLTQWRERQFAERHPEFA